MSPILLPEVFIHGPGTPVNLGTAKADFWLEDAGGIRFKELKQIDVHGTQILQPKDRVHLSLSGIPPNDVMRAAINGTAFVQFAGQDPIQCLNHDNDETQSTWVPLKRLKYGLPTETIIALFELGFSDRIISQDLAASSNLVATQKKDLVKALKQDRDGANAVMEKYPRYFQERMNELLQ